MDENKKDICRLCLTYEDDTFLPLDASTTETLKVVVPELNMDDTAFVICNKCKNSLEESRKLKNIASETEQFIQTQIDKLKIVDKVNLNDIVNKSSDKANEDANSESVNICRICLKNKEVNYMSINEAKTDNVFSSALDTCLSELNMTLTADPEICDLCHNTLCDMFSFKTECLSVEEKVKKYLETATEKELDLNNVLTFLNEESKKSLDDNFLSEFEVKDEEEADIFDIFPNFSGDQFKTTSENETNNKRSAAEEASDVPTKKQKPLASEPKPEDELPHFNFNFNLIFNPKSEGTIEEWLTQVDELKLKFSWSDYVTIHKVLVKLKGLDDLYTWFSNISEILTWTEWKKKLIQMFPDTNDYYIMLKRMINRKKKISETYIEYYNAKLKFLQGLNIAGEKAVSCLIGGITDVAVCCIARIGNYKTPEELLEYFKTCNDKKPTVTSPVKKDLQEKNANTENSTEKKLSPSSAEKKTDRKKRAKCYTCRRPGHTSKECWENLKATPNGTVAGYAKSQLPTTQNPNQRARPRQRPKKKCIHCGKMGHGQQLCPKRPKIGIPPAPKPQQPQNPRTPQQSTSNNRFLAVKKPAKAPQTQKKEKAGAARVRCRNCGKFGHYQNVCRKARQASPGVLNRGGLVGMSEQHNDRYYDMMSRMQVDSSRTVCFKCFRVGHDARDCGEYSSRMYRN